MAMDIWHGEGDAYKRMMQYKEKARAGGFDDLQLNELSLIFRCSASRSRAVGWS